MTTRPQLAGSSPSPDDLRVFLTVVRKAGFAGAAKELGMSPAYVSKRIDSLESVLGVKLFHRTTRQVALTEQGERAHDWALLILNNIDSFVSELTAVRDAPRGTLRVCSSFGLGRTHVASALSLVAKAHPSLDISLEVVDRPIDIIGEGFDLEIRVGDDLPSQHIARKLTTNRRVLCATPEYLETRGAPLALEDLAQHQCLAVKERGTVFRTWMLQDSAGIDHLIKINGGLSSNNGEVVLGWALAGHGIALRSLWDAGPLLESGSLVQVLPEYTQSANVWAIYPTRLHDSAKLRVCVQFLEDHFRRQGSAA